MADRLKQYSLPVDDYATGHVRCPNGCYSGWQVKIDGSITVQGKYEYGIELVSPPLLLSNLGELKTALGIAYKSGAVNSSCGIHVHVHAPELFSSGSNLANISRITNEWNKIEPMIFSYMPMSRRTNVNCKAGVRADDRYQALNVDPLFSPRRTIEFRAHSASLNYDKIASWIMFCIKFVDRIVENRPIELIDPKITLDVPTKLIKPKAGPSFSLHRPQPLWVVETQTKSSEFDDLKTAWKTLKTSLELPGMNFLSDFHFPTYGNAMTKLCEELNIKGVYRSFIEDRYDRMTRRHGFYTSAQNVTTLFGEDEDDFYCEADLG